MAVAASFWEPKRRKRPIEFTSPALIAERFFKLMSNTKREVTSQNQPGVLTRYSVMNISNQNRAAIYWKGGLMSSEM